MTGSDVMRSDVMSDAMRTAVGNGEHDEDEKKYRGKIPFYKINE